MNDRDCVALLQWALPRLEHRWAGYRRVRRQVCRRIAARMHALGLRETAAYRSRLEAQPAEWAALRACLPVTVSRFYRDRGVFQALAQRVLPGLAGAALGRGEHTLLVWSAGCASGEEPYSLALLWAYEVQPGYQELALSVLATDADATVLERAQRACYPASSLRELPPAIAAWAFEPAGEGYCLRPELRTPVRFLRQDLAEEMPEGPFHLILCRNLAFTYFAEALQRRIAGALLERLAPGGCLLLGTHERLPEGFGAPAPEAPGLYRR